jgi:hypothetical protein
MVIVGRLLRQARPQRQDQRSAVQRLDLRLLVDREHHRLLRRLQVEPDDVADLPFQLRVGGELERLSPPRLQPPLPRRRDGVVADPQMRCQQPGRPMRDPQFGRRWLQRRVHDRQLVDLFRPAGFRPSSSPPMPSDAASLRRTPRQLHAAMNEDHLAIDHGEEIRSIMDYLTDLMRSELTSNKAAIQGWEQRHVQKVTEQIQNSGRSGPNTWHLVPMTCDIAGY